MQNTNDRNTESPRKKHDAKCNTKPNARLIWKEIEDHLGPGLRLPVIDRAVYYHLLRHSRLEGKRRLRFSIFEVAQRIHLSRSTVRNAVRRLAGHGILRLIERSEEGHLVEVRLPEEIRKVCAARTDASDRDQLSGISLEKADFLKRKLRSAIHARERGSCFYCMRRMRPAVRCLDHVVPRARFGRNSYRNLVSCCTECNAEKGQRSASDFLRRLYREQRLAATELKRRLAALRDLAAGKLVPSLRPLKD
jgi:5-methylcytosine-specific restriction endonuclease McrA